MNSERDQFNAGRAALREQYGHLFDRIAALLLEADPIDINYGSNADEYKSEAETILPRLALASSALDVQAVVHQEFCRWFDAEEAGEPERYHAVATKIWEEWCAFSSRKA